jgi:sterol desaturase/sphingolipid hydroxylase (fatty acid hydroxylase superfamily)
MHEESTIRSASSTTPLRNAFSCVVFPGTLAIGLGLAIYGFRLGYGPETIVLVLGVATGLWTLFLEFAHPHTPMWQESRGDVRTDALHLVFSEIIPTQLANVLTLTGLTAVAAWLSSSVGYSIWPVGWPLLLQLALLLVIGEFFQYWWHRLTHEHPYFWRFHATHHSPERLYFLNAARFHPIDSVIGYVAQTSPALILGAGPEVVGLFALFSLIHGLFQHANIEVRLGPLNYVFSMAELHRWHHSLRLEDANANYGANIIFWDIVFGTRHLPDDREHQPTDVGLHGTSAFPQDYLGQIASPFTWKRIERESQSEESK